MRSRLLVILIASLLLPAASAGSQADPEIADAGDDASVSRVCAPDVAPVCNAAAGGEAEPHGAAEIIAVWITEPNATHYTIHIQTAAPGDDGTTFALSYNVTPTAISLHTGQDEHTIAFDVTGTASGEEAPSNTAVARHETDPILHITLTRADTGAVGGDAITGLVVTATHVTGDSTPGDAMSWTDTTTDTAPDDGVGRQYNLTRPPIVADLQFTTGGGHVTQVVNGTSQTASFTGSQGNVARGDSTITYNLTLTNAGTDPDSATISVFDPTGTLAAKNITATVSPTSTGTLLPGESVAVTFTAQLNDPPGGQHVLLVSAESERGGAAAEALTVIVPVPPVATPPAAEPEPVEEPEERTPVAGLGFLTPLAEAFGLDDAFGDYAELVLLAIILLLLILILFLVLFLVGRRTIVVEVEPRSIDARPGEVAEFTVNVRNRKKRDVAAVAQFDGDPTWTTSVVFDDAELAQPHTDARLGLGPKGQASGTRTGKLRVRVPETAGDQEADRITLGVAALDAAGEPTRRRQATVRVRAREGAVAQGLPMRLSSVEHEPAAPIVGEFVTTTARLENDSEDETLHLRVVLNLDGDDAEERPVVLPPHSARAVVFRWQVPAGTSKIRVRVYPGE